MSELIVPTASELEALTPAERWAIEDKLDEAQDVLREFNDDELRRWVEVEGKTQTEIAKIVGRSQQRIQQRCAALSLQAWLDSEARRLLREELQADPPGAPTGADDRSLQRVLDDPPPSLDREPLPIVHADGGDTGAAA